MTTPVVHPAIFQLLRLQSRGRRRRLGRRLFQPRRLAASAVACVLAVMWLGNAAVTTWLREAATPETLRAMLSLGLVLYAAWHLAKAAFFRVESPFEWTTTEREPLAMLPLRPRDLVAYQLASVTVTTVLKAGLFTLLLFPDLRCVPLAVVGVLLAMMMLELLRMAVEIATWGMSRSAFLVYRAAVVIGLLAGGFAAGSVIVRAATLVGRIKLGEGVLERVLDILRELNASVFDYAALPFWPFVELIVAHDVTAANVGLAVAALAGVMLSGAAVIGVYSVMVRRVAVRQRRSYKSIEAAHNRTSPSVSGSRLTIANIGQGWWLARVPRWGGAGPLAWRQLIGARRCWSSLLTAMIAPAVLACIPCFVIAEAAIAFLATAGTLAFYTFLLLPTALRFDFRRDLDRMATLKCLPATPLAIAAGQTVAPVLIATLFQAVVLSFAVVARSLPAHYVLSTMLVMVPLNALVFTLENLLFLLYPYRIQQEGVEIFLRTMLMFTGKGLLFALALGAMTVWGFAAADLTRGVTRWTGMGVDPFAVFTAGMVIGPSLLGMVLLKALCRTWSNMDAIEDIPR